MAGRKFIDIGANLTDPMFFGIYYAKSKHPTDLKDVIERARSNGVEKIIITGSSLRDSEEALNIAKTDENLFCTVGCHPTSCKEFHQSGDPEKYLADLGKLAQANKGKVVAIGECGLDYDRLHFCPKEIQLSFFEQQLQLVGALRLPVFLHCRSAFNDLLEVLNYKSDVLCGGVVHSFDGTKEDAQAILDLGYYIGINGCSLKTQRNLEVMATIPSERLMIETDAPWCEVRPSHAGYKYVKTEFETVRRDRWKQGKMVKGRSEPSHINQVLEVMAAVRRDDIGTLCNTLYENAEKLFFSRDN
ncbi:deoxyribonuclease TATDN1 isoform X2 [Anabrus simplex]|uniref:deoxyribonuclease TATDN1 isoform X2 n=1 Tax=Anabrus simplex TaxID=316456 RepID=UPI0035A2D4EA